jgi:hypothetical protein
VIECRECGLRLTEGARFCRACGTPVTGEQPAAGGPKPDPDGGYWAAVGRAGADREGRTAGAAGRSGGTGSTTATAVVPPPPGGPRTTYVGPPPPPDRPTRRPAMVAAAIVGALALVAVAAGIGYLLSREDPDEARGTEGTTTVPPTDGLGPRLEPNSVEASCTASKSRDAAGNVTTYEPSLVLDGNEATAWRCDGTGIGERIVLRFDRPVELTSVGLIPGIVKVDATDGTDRFVQNDKIAAVRWIFDDGQREQELEPIGQLQRTAVDVTTTTVTLEILRVVPGEETTNDAGEPQGPTGKSPIAEIDLRG